MDETPLRAGEAERVEDVDGLSIVELLREPAPLLDFFFLVMFIRQSVGVCRKAFGFLSNIRASGAILTEAEATPGKTFECYSIHRVCADILR